MLNLQINSISYICVMAEKEKKQIAKKQEKYDSKLAIKGDLDAVVKAAFAKDKKKDAPKK